MVMTNIKNSNSNIYFKLQPRFLQYPFYQVSQTRSVLSFVNSRSEIQTFSIFKRLLSSWSQIFMNHLQIFISTSNIYFKIQLGFLHVLHYPTSIPYSVFQNLIFQKPTFQQWVNYLTFEPPFIICSFYTYKSS